jgi:hypothetical protein
MPNEGEAVILEFEFEGKTNATLPPSDSQTTNDSRTTNLRSVEEAAVKNLDEEKDKLSTELQQEAERVFQAFASGSVTTQVELEFKIGESVIVLGTIVAGFVSNVVAGALAPNLAKLIESGFRRIFQGWQRPPWELFTPPQGVNFTPLTVNVSPRQIHQATAEGESEVATEPSHLGTGSAPTGQLSTPWLQIQQQTNSQPPVKETSGAVESRDTYWLFPAIAIGIALIIVLLAVILTIVMMQPR